MNSVKSFGTNEFVLSIWKQAIIRNGGFGDDIDFTKRTLEEDKVLIGYCRDFIANPGLVTKLEKSSPLNASDPSTFYTQGKEGYLDYPTYDSALKLGWDKEWLLLYPSSFM